MPVAIVTGSDSGIGRATAVRLSADGFDVGVTWHEDEQGAQETADEVNRHGARAEVRQLDLADLPDAADVIDDLAAALEGLDVLVNNAGINRTGELLELSYDDWKHTLAVDLDGAFSVRAACGATHGRAGPRRPHRQRHLRPRAHPALARRRLHRGEARARRAAEAARPGARPPWHHGQLRRAGNGRHADDRPRGRGPGAAREAAVPDPAAGRRARDRELHRLAVLARRALDDRSILPRRRRLHARQPLRAARRELSEAQQKRSATEISSIVKLLSGLDELLGCFGPSSAYG